ncbi:MAG: redoxin domain-containing protein [Deltaproteobacteria bacterium]|nr:redoxin domain-containing protein [Deltaproteobacteria bacterium]
MNWKVLLVALIVIVPLVWVLASAFGHDPHALPSTLEGRPAATFSLQDLDGREVSLASYEGRPVVLNFWSTWCVPCVREHAVLQAAARAEGPDGAVFLGVLYGDEPARARAWVARAGSAYPTVVDPTGSLIVDYGVGGVPETFFLDRRHVVAAKVTGPLDVETLARHLEAIR